MIGSLPRLFTHTHSYQSLIQIDSPPFPPIYTANLQQKILDDFQQSPSNDTISMIQSLPRLFTQTNPHHNHLCYPSDHLPAQSASSKISALAQTLMLAWIHGRDKSQPSRHPIRPKMLPLDQSCDGRHSLDGISQLTSSGRWSRAPPFRIKEYRRGKVHKYSISFSVRVQSRRFRIVSSVSRVPRIGFSIKSRLKTRSTHRPWLLWGVHIEENLSNFTWIPWYVEVSRDEGTV